MAAPNTLTQKESKKALRPPSMVMPKRTAFQIVTKISTATGSKLEDKVSPTNRVTKKIVKKQSQGYLENDQSPKEAKQACSVDRMKRNGSIERIAEESKHANSTALPVPGVQIVDSYRTQKSGIVITSKEGSSDL